MHRNRKIDLDNAFNKVLDKINKKGLDSLNVHEKEFLNGYNQETPTEAKILDKLQNQTNYADRNIELINQQRAENQDDTDFDHENDLEGN